MKVSRKWLDQYIDGGLRAPSEKVVEKIGAQLGAVEEVVNSGSHYRDATIVKVEECRSHPGADRLNLCWVNDGETHKNISRDKRGFIQVVCGAPNVRAGMLVVWLPPGAIVPSTYNEAQPIKLEAREIRGQKSFGMLASDKELGISDSHEGLLEIDVPAEPGDNFAKLYDLDDVIIDVENKMFTH